jgi:transcriptional antiterminator RfaH
VLRLVEDRSAGGIMESSSGNNLRWYAIHTHRNQENRTEANLNAFKVETFYPKIKEQRRNEFSGALTSFTKPFFSRYLFARFDIERLLHKVWYTRGVQSIVGYGGSPTPIDDEIIEFFRMRTDQNGFVQLGEELKPGDRVMIKGGPLSPLVGVFERHMNDSERVMILLQTINYQGHIIVERNAIQKVAH